MTPTAWIPYCGAAPQPWELAGRWNLDPALLAALALGAAGLLLWRRGAAPRWLIIAALGLLIVAFVSPLCALASGLFSARTVHHLILTSLAAPLLAWALPAPGRPRLLVWTGASVLVFWLWHLPGAYAAALSSDAVYWLMQLSLLGAAVGFWLQVRAASAPAATLGLAGVMVQMGLPAAVLTFAPQALYAPHFTGPQAFGLTSLEDQQLAGLILWVLGAAPYLLAALARMYGALEGDGRRRPASA